MSTRWIVAAALLFATPALAWDWDVHYRVAVAAGLPSAASHGVSYPDMAREHDRAEYARHYMNEDFFPAGMTLGSLPVAFEAFATRLTVPPEKVGVLLYEIVYSLQEHRRELANAKPADFREMELRVAHYVADLTMPLHLNGNYNGQWTGQKGAHERFEDFADVYVTAVTPAAFPDIRDEAHLWSLLQAEARHSRAVSYALLAIDQAALACPRYDACFRPALPALQAQADRAAGLLRAILAYARRTPRLQTAYRHYE